MMNNKLKSILSISAIVLAVLVVGVFYSSTSGNNVLNHAPGLLDRIESTGVMDVGYGVYPPYTDEDPNTQEVSGFSVDVINEIAKELNAEVVWHRLNWNTMAADLKRGEFDVIADPIFETIPRAREFAFSIPYAKFADGVAVVRKDEWRFNEFADLDKAGITISVGQGWASESLVRNQFSKANINAVQTTTDLLQVFNDVAAGRADVAIADGASVERYVSEHPNSVKALWLDNPPAFMEAGFALRPTDSEGAEFLTVAIRYLRSTGFMDRLAREYNLPIYEFK